MADNKISVGQTVNVSGAGWSGELATICSVEPLKVDFSGGVYTLDPATVTLTRDGLDVTPATPPASVPQYTAVAIDTPAPVVWQQLDPNNSGSESESESGESDGEISEAWLQAWLPRIPAAWKASLAPKLHAKAWHRMQRDGGCISLRLGWPINHLVCLAGRV